MSGLNLSITKGDDRCFIPFCFQYFRNLSPFLEITVEGYLEN